VGACYVLDEPSIGLHTRDTGRLIRILEELRELGNTIVVVEHDPDVMRAADHIVDLGPGAGEHGGNIVFEGPLSRLRPRTATSLTARYLSGELRVSAPRERRPVDPAACCASSARTLTTSRISTWKFRSA
jgi:excinuclease ABC subunit A